jgi:hypothetical protein
MALTWTEIAAQVRPAEDRLIERYVKDFFKDDVPQPGLGYPTLETPRGTGRALPIISMYVTGIRRLSAWPETMIVLDAFWENFPDRRFVLVVSIWPPSRWQDPEPPYNEMFYVNLAGWIHKRSVRWMSMQPGPLVHFIWSSSVDFDRPLAPGDPPPDLLAARSEIDEIKSVWTDPRRGS